MSLHISTVWHQAYRVTKCRMHRQLFSEAQGPQWRRPQEPVPSDAPGLCGQKAWRLLLGRGSGSQDKDSGSGWAEVGHGHLLLGPEQAGSKCISEAFCLLCHFILDWGGPSSWHWVTLVCIEYRVSVSLAAEPRS